MMKLLVSPVSNRISLQPASKHSTWGKVHARVHARKDETAGGGGEKRELATISHEFSFHPGNPETLQSVKTVTTSAPFNGISLRLDEVEMRIYERSLQALLSSASRSLARTTARLARFARPNGELARRLISLCRVKVLLFI